MTFSWQGAVEGDLIYLGNIDNVWIIWRCDAHLSVRVLIEGETQNIEAEETPRHTFQKKKICGSRPIGVNYLGVSIST